MYAHFHLIKYLVEVGPSHVGSVQRRRVESQAKHNDQSESAAHRSTCTLTQQANMNIIVLNIGGSVVDGSLSCRQGFKDAAIQSWDFPHVLVEDANIELCKYRHFG
jgi:hypothetical protein